jgi:hypothetical protein
VRADGALEERFVHRVSVKGIAQASAITLLAELSVLPADMSARQWVAYAGLDPKHSESGTSVTGAVRISKVGNRHLRAALFPARDGGVPTRAVMRKLLHAIHGMFHHDADFDRTRYFSVGCGPCIAGTDLRVGSRQVAREHDRQFVCTPRAVELWAGVHRHAFGRGHDDEGSDVQISHTDLAPVGG